MPRKPLDGKLTIPTRELAELVGDTLAYLGASDDQIRAMATGWASSSGTSEVDAFAHAVRMQAAGLSASRRRALREDHS